VDSDESYHMFVKVIDKGLFRVASDETIQDATKMRIDCVGYDFLREVPNTGS